MGQQYIVIKNMPTPGSDAWRARQARLKEKGKLSDEESAAIDRIEGNTPAQGQRQQPVSKKRAKKSGAPAKPANPAGGAKKPGGGASNQTDTDTSKGASGDD